MHDSSVLKRGLRGVSDIFITKYIVSQKRAYHKQFALNALLLCLAKLECSNLPPNIHSYSQHILFCLEVELNINYLYPILSSSFG